MKPFDDNTTKLITICVLIDAILILGMMIAGYFLADDIVKLLK